MDGGTQCKRRQPKEHRRPHPRCLGDGQGKETCMGPVAGWLGMGSSIGKLVAAAKSSGSPGKGCLPGGSPTGWAPMPLVPPDELNPSAAPAPLKDRESSALPSCMRNFPLSPFLAKDKYHSLDDHLLWTAWFSYPRQRLLQGFNWLGGTYCLC